MDRKKRSGRTARSLTGGRERKLLLELEKGSFLKKWTGRTPVALLYPNTYRVGMSSLGFQLVYRLLNEYDHIVCERVFLPEGGAPPVSVESGRPLDNFPLLFCSVSFEHDYVNLAALLVAGGLEPYAARRPEVIAPGSPLVIGGGVATFMNPEPLAPFVDLFVVGEAEPLLPPLLATLAEDGGRSGRLELLRRLNRDHDGFYAPRFYTPRYDERGQLRGMQPETGLPGRVKKVVLARSGGAAHSEVLTPETEFADLYLTELGRGCSRGCRFCAAGFIYRPARLWDREAVLESLRQRPEGVDRIGLLGMEMTDPNSLEAIAGEISRAGCALSFSSLRADRISGALIDLLAESGLKSVAIAPDGASERLRRVINKGLGEEDLLTAARRLAEAGLAKLKLYLMVGLPSETEADLAEFLALVEKMRALIDPIGQRRGRLCELAVSVNSFTPKPWTPFQYHPFGRSERLESGDSYSGQTAVRELKGKIAFLRQGLAGQANTRVSFDNPDHVLFQAVLARGDRRLAGVLLDMAVSGISWKQAMKRQGLGEELFATRQYGETSYLPWYIIDHAIHESYLWKEYLKSFQSRLTPPCESGSCRRCGVCHD